MVNFKWVQPVEAKTLAKNDMPQMGETCPICAVKLTVFLTLTKSQWYSNSKINEGSHRHRLRELIYWIHLCCCKFLLCEL